MTDFNFEGRSFIFLRNGQNASLFLCSGKKYFNLQLLFHKNAFVNKTARTEKKKVHKGSRTVSPD